MHCLAGCFGLPCKFEASKGCDGLKSSSPCPGEARSATGGRRAEGTAGNAEQLDWAGLVSLLTGEVPHGDWWDILQSASAALTKRLPADHASIFMLAGAGVAALSSSGVPLFGLRLGQLLLPNSSGCSSGTLTSSDDSSPLRRPELDVCALAAALQDQTASVPIAFRSVDTSPSGAERKQQPSEWEGSCSSNGGGKGTAGGRQRGRLRDSASGVDCGGGACLRHYVAVGIPGGKSAAGMFILSATGPSPPAAWQAEGLGLVAALLAPLLRPPQVPLARRTLAELHAAATINELVHSLSGAAADLLVAAVRVAMQPRVALLRNDGTAAAVFAVHEGGGGGGGGTSVCQRRSREVVLVDAGGSGYSGIKQPVADFFMLGHHSVAERDSLGTAGGGGGGGGGGGTLGKSYGGLPGGGPSCASGARWGVGCRGQSLPLQHTLLSEALTRGSGLCIADCNAYVQDSKAFPRDLMLFPRGGAAPPQSLALATCCHSGKPLLALYATYHSILPQALLQTVVQELGQLLRALTPTVAALVMPGGPMADEWSLLHDDLLGPSGLGLGSSACARGQQRTSSNPTAGPHLPPPPLPPAEAAATMAATPPPPSSAVAAASPGGAPAAGCCPPSLLMGPMAGSADGHSTVGSPSPSPCPSPSCEGGRSPRSSAGGPAAVAAAAAAGGGGGGGGVSPLGVVAQIGAFFRRTSAGGGSSSRPQNNATRATPLSPRAPGRAAAGAGGGGGGAAAGGGQAAAAGHAAEVLISAMNAAAEQLTAVTDAATTAAAGSGDRRSDSSATASKRLAAFVSSGTGGTTATTATALTTTTSGGGAVPTAGSLRSGPSRLGVGHSHTGRTSFSLEAAGSPRGGLRLAPLITTLHDRLKSAQAEQLTASSRVASRVQDLGSLRLLERVGKGGYGSVYRGLYHGAEVAIKVVEDISPNGSTPPLAGGNAAAAAKSPPAAAAAAAAAAAPVILRAKHLHDAVELVASVSMSHPNIVQLITYFVDVKAQHRHRPRPALPPQLGPASHTAAAAAAAAGGGAGEAADGAAGAAGAQGGGGGGADGYESGVLQLVHMASSGVNSTDSSFTEPSGNEAIVLVMEYCDRGSLKEAIQDGSFLQREALAQVQALQRHLQLQQQPQRGQGQGQTAGQQQQQQLVQQQQQMVARGGVALLNMKAVYSTLLEVALALRHMHGLHLVHCDLKPQNVLLKSSPRDPRGFTAKLSDFGLAKMMEHDADGQLVIDDGIQSGTITHLPPEALTGCRQLGPAVDVYAFGVVMFQMLCGMTVYRGLDVRGMIRGVVRHGLRPSFPAWVPAEYRDLAQRCWHEQPACRPTSLQLVSELEALLEACDPPHGWAPSRRGVGVSLGGSLGSMRPALGATATATPATATASHRRLPSRCATETALHAMPQPAPAVAAAAAAAAAEVVLRHPPLYLYQRPQQLYQPSGAEPVRPPGGAAANKGPAAAAAAAAASLAAAGTVPPPPPPPPGAAPGAPSAAAAAGSSSWMTPTFGSTGGGAGGGGGVAKVPAAPHQPPSLYTRTPEPSVATPTTLSAKPTRAVDPASCVVWSATAAPTATVTTTVTATNATAPPTVTAAAAASAAAAAAGVDQPMQPQRSPPLGAPPPLVQ